MPKYNFECPSCNLNFSRVLKAAEHPEHPCPKCKGTAKRHWHGQGFAFGFQATKGTDQGNSGVSKDDYPTADHHVGRTAEQRWAHIHERDEVKEGLRKQAGTHALSRQNGQGYVDYHAMSDQQLAARKETAKEVFAAQEAAAADGR